MIYNVFNDYKFDRYNILVDHFKFTTVYQNEWYRKYMGVDYFFTYTQGYLVLTIRDIDGSINKREFYDDYEFKNTLNILFPIEARLEKLKRIL